MTNQLWGESPCAHLPTPLRSLTRVWMVLLAGCCKQHSSLMTMHIYHQPHLGFYSLEMGFVLPPHAISVL